MPQASDQPLKVDPTAAEIFRVIRNTMMASIEGLRSLLEECADLRIDLVRIHNLHADGDEVFAARQQDRILKLLSAAQEMEALLASLPQGASEGEDGSDERLICSRE